MGRRAGARADGGRRPGPFTRARSGARRYGEFLWEFVKRPGLVGAVAPSSAFLARRMLDWIDLSNARVVLECGPGTGSFTEEILRRRGDGCRYVGIEVNPALGRLFRERYPGLRLYETTVEKVARVCEEEGISEVDCIVSGLPWASFSEAHQTELLEAMVSVLKPGGQFATFAYLQGLLLPAGIRFRRRLRRYFGEVSASRIVWLNFPPAFVYRCRR